MSRERANSYREQRTRLSTRKCPDELGQCMLRRIGLSSARARLSPPRENVLLVPHRNVLLTRSGWEGAGTRSSNHDPARQRPPGGAQESIQGINYTTAGSGGVRPDGSPDSKAPGADEGGGRPRRDSWVAWPLILRSLP